MNILFYLEPKFELSIYFRYATLRNSFLPQINAFTKMGHRVGLVLSTTLADKALKDGYLKNEITLFPIASEEFLESVGNYDFAAEKIYNDDVNINQQMVELIEKTSIIHFVPDLIISWESPVNFFKLLFPNAKIIYQWPGFFSRKPFPEFIHFDLGLLNNSIVNSINYQNLNNDFKEVKKELYKIKELLTEVDPTIFMRDYHQFDKLILFPLQIDDYFTVTIPLEKKKKQFDVLIDVLKNTPENIGVVVTEYKSKDIATNLLTPEIISFLKQKYSNFVYRDEFKEIQNISQYLATYVDGVVTISSSLGLQAAFWNKPLYVVGKSHLNVFASSDTYTEFLEQVKNNKKNDKDNMLYALFLKTEVPLNEIKNNPAYFVTWIESLIMMENKNDLVNYHLTPKNLATFLKGNFDINMLDTSYFDKNRLEQRTYICKELADQIDKKQVISFDIFDTLLVRPFMRPDDLFYWIEDEVRDIVGDLTFNFFEHRKAAEHQAFQNSLQESRGETTLDEIYNVFSQLTSIEHDKINLIKNLEIQTETQLLYRRKSGYKAFLQAQAKEKKVILISDMYLPKDVIENILKKNGYTNYYKLYLSSEYNEKKHSGKLFDIVLNDLNVAPDSILHVGDNFIADVKKPKEKNIKPFHLVKASESFKKSDSYIPWLRDEARRNLSANMLLAFSVNHLHDNPYIKNKTGLFNGLAYNLGFYGAGAFMLGFTKWIIETAIERKISKIFFLARDGKIIKKIYDEISPYYKNAPTSEYLLCSRRAVNVAKLKSKSCIHDLISVDYANNMRLGDLILNRFGIDNTLITNELLKPFDLGWTTKITEADRPRIIHALTSTTIQTIILNAASRERDNYSDYLNTIGFYDPKDTIAIVDIGYAGTMQQSLSVISARKDIQGFYLMTFRTALLRLKKNGLKSIGYLGSYIDRHDTSNPFCSYVPLYETLFSAEETSFVKMEKNYKNELTPVYMDSISNEQQRARVVNEIQKGVLDFVKKVAMTLDVKIFKLDIEPHKSMRILQSYFASPSSLDAQILCGITFEDAYGGGGAKVILPEKAKLIATDCVWKNGKKVILETDSKYSKSILGKINKNYVTPVTYFFLSKILSKQHRNKLKNNPKVFFSDSKSFLIKKFGKYFLK